MPLIRALRNFLAGCLLLVQGGALVLHHQQLRQRAVKPFLLTLVLYVIGGGFLVHTARERLALLLNQPDPWYLVLGQAVLAFITVAGIVAIALFAFVLVARIIATPFLTQLSEDTERQVRGQITEEPFAVSTFVGDFGRAIGHSLALIVLLGVTFPLSFIPVIGPIMWIGSGWGFLAYDFASFTMDRRHWSLKEKYRLLRSAWPRVLGFGAATFVLMAVPVGGLIALPAATVAGTLLVLELEEQSLHTKGAAR
jgi:CysZ protein